MTLPLSGYHYPNRCLLISFHVETTATGSRQQINSTARLVLDTNVTSMPLHSSYRRALPSARDVTLCERPFTALYGLSNWRFRLALSPRWPYVSDCPEGFERERGENHYCEDWVSSAVSITAIEILSPLSSLSRISGATTNPDIPTVRHRRFFPRARYTGMTGLWPGGQQVMVRPVYLHCLLTATEPRMYRRASLSKPRAASSGGSGRGSESDRGGLGRYSLPALG